MARKPLRPPVSLARIYSFDPRPGYDPGMPRPLFPVGQWQPPRDAGQAAEELVNLEHYDTIVTWRRGRTILAIRDQGLHAGYSTFLAWMQSAACPFTEQYTRKLIEFVNVFDDEMLAVRAGITRGYELIRLCALSGEDPKRIVRDDLPVAGRPYSQHTRRSLADVIRGLEGQRHAQAVAEAAEVLGTDDGRADPDFERPAVVPLPRDIERSANRTLRAFIRWARAEGADVPVAYIHKYASAAWATFRLPAGQLALLFD